MPNNPAQTVQLGDFALHTVKAATDDEETLKLELVAVDDTEDWKRQKAPGVIDSSGRETRLLGNIVNSRGLRSCTFPRAVEMLKPSVPVPFLGG